MKDIRYIIRWKEVIKTKIIIFWQCIGNFIFVIQGYNFHLTLI